MNKYFDLLWVRKLAWQSTQLLKEKKNPFKLSKARLGKLEESIAKQLDQIYPDDKKARMISVKIEKLALDIKRASMNRMSDEMISKVMNQPEVDSYMKKFVKDSQI